MERTDRRWILGALLVVAGILFLLQNLGIFNFDNSIWGFLFALGGLAFLWVVVNNRAHWWALIPGMVLLGIGGLILMGIYFPSSAALYGGPFFLGMISLSFWLIYFLHNDLWWAVSPAGVMLTIAAVAGLGQIYTGVEIGGVLFLGMGLTFLLLSVIPTPQGRMRWPLIPGIVLVLFGVIIGSTSSTAMRFFWPVVLILAGIFIFFRRSPAHR